MTNNSKEIEEAEKAAAPEKQDLLSLNADDADRGAITLSKNCIARIVSKTAAGIEGFARFAPKGAGDILNIFSGKAYDSSMVIEFQDGAVNLKLAVNLYYGVYLPGVIKELKTRIADQIAAITGAKVGRIDVYVKDLVAPEDVENGDKPSEEDAEGDAESKEE